METTKNKNHKSRRIKKFTEKDLIPDNAKFLFAKEELIGSISGRSFYETVFYYETITT